MALNISDHADVYHVLFHTNDAKITNSCQVVTESDSTLVKPLFRKSTDDNLALKSKSSYIDIKCNPKSDFFFSTKVGFDSDMKDFYPTSISAKIRFIVVSNLAEYIDVSFDTTLKDTTTLAVSRKDNKVTVYKDGNKVSLYDDTFKGNLSYIKIETKADAITLKTVIDDVIFVNNESVLTDNYTIALDKSEISNNAVVVDTSNNTYGVVPK